MKIALFLCALKFPQEKPIISNFSLHASTALNGEVSGINYNRIHEYTITTVTTNTFCGQPNIVPLFDFNEGGRDYLLHKLQLIKMFQSNVITINVTHLKVQLHKRQV